MAVYTKVTEKELQKFIANYKIGNLLSFHGIKEGVENTNYLLKTETGPYILTVYEKRVRKKDIPFFLSFMKHLFVKKINCPLPIRRRDGKNLGIIKKKSAAIITFLTGKNLSNISPKNCFTLGKIIAKMHLASRNFKLKRSNDLSINEWASILSVCKRKRGKLKIDFFNELSQEISFLKSSWPKKLPKGIVHTDLFPDNVFFKNNRITGLIDFYFSCYDFLAYDLAVCINAWCFEKNGNFNRKKSQALLKGYNKVRKLRKDELNILPILTRGAALRFLLTRLYDWSRHNKKSLVKPKDPLEFVKKLRFHQKIKDSDIYRNI